MEHNFELGFRKFKVGFSVQDRFEICKQVIHRELKCIKINVLSAIKSRHKLN